MSQEGAIRDTGRTHPAGGVSTSRKHCEELAIKTAIVLFTRDLRVRDNPALATACEHTNLVYP